MHDNEKEIVQVVGRFYMYVFDSAMRYFQEECSNCAKLFSTAEGRVELACMIVAQILAGASYQVYTNDAADLLHDDSISSEDTLRLVVLDRAKKSVSWTSFST